MSFPFLGARSLPAPPDIEDIARSEKAEKGTDLFIGITVRFWPISGRSRWLLKLSLFPYLLDVDLDLGGAEGLIGRPRQAPRRAHQIKGEFERCWPHVAASVPDRSLLRIVEAFG